MAKKISDLTPATELGDNDSFVLNDVAAGNDKRVTALVLKSSLGIDDLNEKVSLFSESEIYQIGDNGDYPDLQSAVDSLTRRIKDKSNIEIVLNLKSGYELKSGNIGIDREASLYVSNNDFSHIRITSDDAVVEVEDGFSGSCFRCENGKNVTLDCLIDMKGLGEDGYTAEWAGSSGQVMPGAGVMNAPRIGLYSRSGADIWADGGVIFTGAGWRGCYANHTSRAYIRNGDFSGLTNHGAYTPDAAVMAQHAATIDAFEADVSDSLGVGFKAVNGCIIYGSSGNANNCVTGIYIDSSIGVFGSCTANDCSEYGFHVRNASIIQAAATQANNCERGYFAENAAFINARNGSADDCVFGFYIDHGSTINAENADANNCSSPAIYCLNKSEINAPEITANLCTAGSAAAVVRDGSTGNFRLSTLTNASGHALEVTDGSKVNAKNSDLSNAGSQAVFCTAGEACIIDSDVTGAGTTNAVVAQDGGIIRATGIDGSITTSPTENTITSDGIIFR